MKFERVMLICMHINILLPDDSFSFRAGKRWGINGCGSGRSYSPNQTTRRSSFNINEMSCTIRNKTELSMDVVCKEENYGMKEKHGIKDRERLVMNQ